LDDRRKDGGTNSTLRTKEQGTHLTLNEHDDNDGHALILHYRAFQNIRKAGLYIILFTGIRVGAWGGVVVKVLRY